MTINKKEILDNISDETKELHPLLEKLLRKLPDVMEVEYTHGPDEMGADFVLSKRDSSLGITSYVGIIAKLGKIHQDFTDIERQIKECDVERTFQSGKKKISIDEIWVIATANITGGAKKKILTQYSTRKIIFIAQEKLIELIDKFFPAFWSQIDVSIADYLSGLTQKTKQNDISFSLVQIDGAPFYIDQDVYEVPNLSYKKMKFKRKKVRIHNEIQKQKLILIEGGMGSGKSKLLRELVYHYGNPAIFKQTELIPVYISATEFVDKHEAKIAVVIQNIVSKDVFDKIDKPRFLIFVDGLDEKNLSFDEINQLLSNISNQLAELDNVKLLITTRYLKALEQAEVTTKSVARYELPPLSFAKTIEFLKRICIQLNTSSRLLEDLRKSQLFRELPKSPMAAIILARLINENPKELPSNMTELYSQYLELMLGRWDIDKGLQSLKEFNALEKIVMELAQSFVNYELDYLTITDAKNIIKDYLQQRNLGLDSEELFEKLVKRSEILVLGDQGQKVYFKHRTFAEYFYARFMSLSDKFDLADKVFTIYWAEIVFFYFGLKTDAPELLTEINNLNPKSEVERWLKIINMSSYVLAAHSTPYNVVNEIMYQTVLSAAILYKDIVDKKITSPLQQLSTMANLFLMQLIMRDSYSYEFFKPAIEDAALKIDYSELEAEIKAFALYFLDVTNIEMGAGESFDFLLKKYKEEIPVELALAIGFEKDNLKQKTKLMRKQDKRIRKMLGTYKQKKILDDLYDVPVRKVSEEKEKYISSQNQ